MFTHRMHRYLAIALLTGLLAMPTLAGNGPMSRYLARRARIAVGEIARMRLAHGQVPGHALARGYVACAYAPNVPGCRTLLYSDDTPAPAQLLAAAGLSVPTPGSYARRRLIAAPRLGTRTPRRLARLQR